MHAFLKSLFTLMIKISEAHGWANMYTGILIKKTRSLGERISHSIKNFKFISKYVKNPTVADTCLVLFFFWN